MTEQVNTEAFNPMAAEMAVDPYPHYRRLRERDPVHFLDAMGIWILTRHADVSAFFADRSLLHMYSVTQTIRLGETVGDERYFQLFQHMVFVQDPPDHTRIRRLLTSSFTPKRVQALRPHVERIADRLLDAVSDARAMDVVDDFARPFPIQVIGELLGVPSEDRSRLGALSELLNPALEFVPMQPDTVTQVNEAVTEMADYFAWLADRRRSDPLDDLISAMVHASEDGVGLTADELKANAILMYLAGHETTAGGTGLAVLALHRNPDQLTRLLADPALIPGAVVELLRYDGPGQATARVTTQPVTFGDTEIAAGSGVIAYMGAANRDPAMYAEPERLDITRNQRSASFGGGAHLCIGHALAHQELEIALSRLLARMPTLKLDTLEPQFRPTALMRGVASLPATW